MLAWCRGRACARRADTDQSGRQQHGDGGTARGAEPLWWDAAGHGGRWCVLQYDYFLHRCILVGPLSLGLTRPHLLRASQSHGDLRRGVGVLRLHLLRAMEAPNMRRQFTCISRYPGTLSFFAKATLLQRTSHPALAHPADRVQHRILLAQGIVVLPGGSTQPWRADCMV